MLAQRHRRRKEHAGEVERRGRSRRHEPSAALAGDVDEAFGDVRRAGKYDGRGAGADRRLGGAGIVATVEEGGELRCRHGRTRRRDERAPPAGTAIDRGAGGARKRDVAPGLGRRRQRRNGVGQRMDDDDRGVSGQCIAPK